MTRDEVNRRASVRPLTKRNSVGCATREHARPNVSKTRDPACRSRGAVSKIGATFFRQQRGCNWGCLLDRAVAPSLELNPQALATLVVRGGGCPLPKGRSRRPALNKPRRAGGSR